MSPSLLSILQKGINRKIDSDIQRWPTLWLQKNNFQCRIADFLLVCTKAVYIAINLIPVTLYIIGLSKPEVLWNIHKKERSSEQLATNRQKYRGTLYLIEKCLHKKTNWELIEFILTWNHYLVITLGRNSREGIQNIFCAWI